MKIDVSIKELDLITKALGYYFHKSGLTEKEIDETDYLMFVLRQLLYLKQTEEDLKKTGEE